MNKTIMCCLLTLKAQNEKNYNFIKLVLKQKPEREFIKVCCCLLLLRRCWYLLRTEIWENKLATSHKSTIDRWWWWWGEKKKAPIKNLSVNSLKSINLLCTILILFHVWWNSKRILMPWRNKFSSYWLRDNISSSIYWL